MSRRILYGPSQGELLDACIDGICRDVASRSGQRATLLVPEQTKADAERRFLTRTGQPGLLRAEVLSFRRLAFRVAGESGGLARGSLDAVGKSILLHALLRDHREEWTAIRSSAGRPGFVPEVEHVIGDLKRYGIGADELEQAAESEADKDRFFAAKMTDLAKLLRLYNTYVDERGLRDRDDDLWRLAETLEAYATARADGTLSWPLKRLGFLEHTSVWVAGFGQIRDFTPQEYQILDGLAAVCDSLVLTVCTDVLPGDAASASSGPDAFQVGRRVALRLSERYLGLVPQAVPAPLHPDLDRAGKALLNETGNEIQETEARVADDAAVNTLCVHSSEDELRWVAGEIRRLTLQFGYRYRDIAIGAGSLQTLLPALRAVFRSYGLSPFIDEPRPLTGTPLFGYLDALLSLTLRQWSQPAVAAFLRTDFCGIDRADADFLDNYLLARGLSGSSRIFDNRRFMSGTSLQDMPEEQEEHGIKEQTEPEARRDRAAIRRRRESVEARRARTLRDQHLKPVRTFLDRLSALQSGQELCATLAGYLEESGVRARLTARLSGLRELGENEAAVTLARSWNELEYILRQIAQIAGDRPFTPEAFRDALSAGAEGTRSGSIPPVIDQVAVSGYDRALFRRPKVLFLLGLGGSGFPGRSPQEGILKDPDRERISTRTGIDLPSVLRDQVFSDAAMAYALVTAPSEKLYLLAHRENGGVSPYFERVRNAVPSGRHEDLGIPSGQDVRLASWRSARRHIYAAADATIPDEPDRLATLRALSDVLDLADEERASGRWRAWMEEDREAVSLSRALSRAAAGPHPAMSVSQLETYAACPYSYLAAYFFKLEEREVWKPRTTDTGVLLHSILETAVDELSTALSGAGSDAERERILSDWVNRDVDTYLRGILDGLLERDGLASFADPGIRASAGRRVLRLGSVSLGAVFRQLTQDGAEPLHTEWRFGMGDNADAELKIHAPGASVVFRGVVDRVDRMPGESHLFRIVDYKSGMKEFDPDAVFYGLSLQLPAYAAAYRAAHPDEQPADLTYFRFRDPYARFPVPAAVNAADADKSRERAFRMKGTGLDPEDIERVADHTKGRMRALCGALLSGHFSARPARIGSTGAVSCRYCPYHALCGHGGKNWYHMTPLRDLIPADVAKKKPEKLMAAIHKAEEEGDADAADS